MSSTDAIRLEHLEGVWPLLELLQVGFVLIAPDGEVRHATSSARVLFGRRRLDGAQLRDLLGELDREIVAPVFSGHVSSTRWREHRFQTPRGVEMHVAMRTSAVLGPADERMVMLAIYDVSVEVGLHRRYKQLVARQEAINEELRVRIAEELREHEDDLAQFSELLQIAPAIFASFVGEANAAVAAIAAVAGEPTDETLVRALREGHTVKGNARGLGLNFIAGRAHAVEDLIAGARERGEPPAAKELEASLEDLRRAIDRAVALRGGLESASGPEHGADGRALVEINTQLTAAIAALGGDHPARAPLAKASAALERLARVPLSQLLHFVRVTARSVAAASGVDVPNVDVRGGDVTVPPAIHDALHTALPHLVRNAIVHGIEPGDQRIALGKPAAGTITVDARVDSGQLVVQIKDDGRGVDRDRLARALGDAGGDASVLSLEDLVFHPGLSSRGAVDRDSGRGMGALAARDALAALGGTLEVETSPGTGTTFTARVPLRR
ncbi:MAG TPA: ATP-binding protein [Kofleriaceae bacterium]|nr:ATP-binding protein [Kofleriaceae bacterium]